MKDYWKINRETINKILIENTGNKIFASHKI